MSFGSNAVDPSRKLSYRWDFGDGTSSTEAAPAHAYARSGVFTVRLTLTNEAGATATSEGTVSISDLAIVAGKNCGGAGWCWQRPLPQGNAILDHHFVDAQRGWAVGEAGTVLVTSDGGLSWTRRASGTDLNLMKVTFADPLNGWIAGEVGYLLRTTDGGATWTSGSTGTSNPPDALGAYDASSPWMIASGIFASSVDAGGTWHRHDGSLYASHFSTGAKGDLWHIEWGHPSYVLKHSTDGGAQWTAVALPALEAHLSRWIESVQFVSATHGWMRAQESGYNNTTQTYDSRTQLLRTTDAGASWQPFTDPWAGSGGAYSAVFRFADAATGYAWHGYQTSLKRSTDAGMSWSDVTLPIGAHISSLKVFSPLVLMVIDWNGRVLLSTDGGTTWAVGDAGTVLRTVDGGLTWTVQTTGTRLALQGSFFLDEQTGWVVGAGGTILVTATGGR